MRWRLLLDPPFPGALNMATDEALLARARRSGEAVLRVYAWSAPTLSLGRHQTARGVYESDRLAAAGVSVVRRLTGGRAVLHHREVTYSVTAPEDGSPLAESYGRINRLLLDALRRLGVRAELARPEGRTAPPGSAPCFELPGANEVVVDGRKLVGSAQLREEGALLQHGSILVDDDQGLVGTLASVPVPAASPAATLREAIGRAPTPEEVAGALFDAVRALEDPDASPPTDEAQLRAAAEAALDRYRSPEWTWRR